VVIFDGSFTTTRKGQHVFNKRPKDLVTAKGWTKGQRLFLAFNERGNIELAAAP
jgi:hypothetical protein